MDELSLIALFCHVDDFYNAFESEYNKKFLDQDTPSKRWWTTRESRLCPSELMTIALLFHKSNYRTFKHFYIQYVQSHLSALFPDLVSYKQLNKLMRRILFPLFVFQHSLRGNPTGIGFVDSTVLSVCHICRASGHKVFKRVAKKGKTTTGWFYGLKLHLVINHTGEILAWMLSAGNVDDRSPVPVLTKGMFGKIYGDRGYISKQLFEKLYEQGVQLVTRLRARMKNMLMDTVDKVLLFKRSLVETVINKLKTQCQIEHHRHRSLPHFMVNLLAGLAAYSLEQDKPTLRCELKNFVG